jgi:glycosyltransferase involved in cell wall biosynthesis
MKILWLTWKDPYHPLAGGAEVVQAQLCTRLVVAGHSVTILTAAYGAAPVSETRSGVQIIRQGGKFSVYWHAASYYKANLIGWADIVLEEVNTIPFFARFYVQEPHILFFHQLARSVWWYQMVFPLSLVGYMIEPLYLHLINRSPVITVSESTKADLVRYGFTSDNISIISEGITLEPLTELSPKPSTKSVLSLGAVRPMKRTLDIVKAFEIAQATMPELKLHVAGDTSGSYGAKVLQYIKNSPCRSAITVHGRVNTDKKLQLMREASVVAVTSIKEGWGLVVTEANSQGTPAVVYDVDGLRDSTRDGVTGLITKQNTPAGLATSIIELLANESRYEQIRTAAWQWSKEITFDQAYQDFMNVLNKYGK